MDTIQLISVAILDSAVPHTIRSFIWIRIVKVDSDVPDITPSSHSTPGFRWAEPGTHCTLAEDTVTASICSDA